MKFSNGCDMQKRIHSTNSLIQKKKKKSLATFHSDESTMGIANTYLSMSYVGWVSSFSLSLSPWYLKFVKSDRILHNNKQITIQKYKNCCSTNNWPPQPESVRAVSIGVVNGSKIHRTRTQTDCCAHVEFPVHVFCMDVCVERLVLFDMQYIPMRIAISLYPLFVLIIANKLNYFTALIPIIKCKRYHAEWIPTFICQRQYGLFDFLLLLLFSFFKRFCSAANFLIVFFSFFYFCLHSLLHLYN